MTKLRTSRHRHLRLLSILVAVGGLLTLAIGPALGRTDRHTTVASPWDAPRVLDMSHQAVLGAEDVEEVDEVEAQGADTDEVESDSTDLDEDAQGDDSQGEDADENDQGDPESADEDSDSDEADENDSDEADESDVEEHDGDGEHEDDGEHDD